MEVTSFRIRNYRSIKDSGICYLSGDRVTVLAGKNESGKTAILEALHDFNVDTDIRKEAIPFYDKKRTPEIAITFQTDSRELGKVFKQVGLQHPEGETWSIEIVKKYPGKYTLSEESRNLLQIDGVAVSDALQERQKQFSRIYAKVKGIYAEFPNLGGSLPELGFENLRKLKRLFRTFVKVTQPNLVQIADEQVRETFSEGLQEVIKAITDMDNLRSIEKKLLSKIKSHIPNFVLFSTFEDQFPSEIPLAEAQKNDLILDLAVVSNLDLELVKSGTIEDKTRHKEELNVSIKREYKRFWTQDLANLHFEWDSEKLYFFVKVGKYPFPPRLRSKGKQWHLAFYTRVTARSKEDKPNVILIDEPGLFLHAKAQEDVLKKLEEAAKDTAIIFSTHSPYLIDVNNLGRVRLVYQDEEDGKGTTVSNKIHKAADKETLTPVITAIGLDLSRGLDVAKDNNIIVEGISDYYYVCAFMNLLDFQFDKEVHLIPAVGANNAGLLVPLMIGWGLNYCVLLDNDAEGRRVHKKLSKRFSHIETNIVFISENRDEEIEDLFESSDFITQVLPEAPEKVEDGIRNSQIIKERSNGYDRVLLAKSFLEKAQQERVSLTTTTKENFTKALQRINKAIFR